MQYLAQPSAAFPVHALPELVRNAVNEVNRNIQAPMALIASSALSAISLSCQHAVDVLRPNGLVTPVSLALMVIAESGERKTTVDRIFTKAIQEYQDILNAEAKKNFMNTKPSELFGKKVWHISMRKLTKPSRRIMLNGSQNLKRS